MNQMLKSLFRIMIMSNLRKKEMKCTKCGSEIPENSKYCLSCGEKIEEQNAQEKGKEKKKGSLFVKLISVLLVIGGVIFLLALLRKRPFSVAVIIFQYAFCLLALFIHKGILKLEKEWIKYIFLLLGSLLLILSIKCFGWGKEKKVDPTPIEEITIVEEEPVEDIALTIPLSPEEFATMDYNTAKKTLEESGFINISLEKAEELKYDETDKLDLVKEVSIDGTTSFLAGDTIDENAQIVIKYYTYAKCKVNVHVKFLSNLLLNKHDVRYTFEDITEGVLPHGEDLDLEVNVEPGEYSLLFTDVEDAAVKGEIVVSVKGDMNASYGIRCASEEIATTTVYIEEYGILKENEIMLPNTAVYYTDMTSYKDCEAALMELGFTNIKTVPVYDIVLGITEEGETKSVTINGNSDFNIGDVFTNDAEVIIEYHMKSVNAPDKTTEPEKTASDYATDAPSEGSDAVWYSTNDLETAKNGNVGVYSYKKSGSSYDIYYVIDFDEGYVYRFLEGDGNEECDRLKIESGDLNDVLIITYHLDENYPVKLHFKYKNAPATMIVKGYDGFEDEFMTTDLNDALTLMKSKEVTDY